MTAVTKSTIFSQPFDTVFSIIDTRSNVADPRGGTTRKFVYDSEPFVKAYDFSNYPYIVVKMPTITQTQSSSDNKHKMVEYTQTILVRTVKGGSSGSRTDAGHSDAQSIVDDLFETFNAKVTRLTMGQTRLFKSEIVIVNTDDVAVDAQKALYEITLELVYGMRIDVTV